MSTFRCSSCQKDIPIINQVIHQVQCSRNRSNIISNPTYTDVLSMDEDSAVELLDDDELPVASSSSYYPTEGGDKWPCNSCTYLNPNSRTICEMCSKSRNLLLDTLEDDIPVEVYNDMFNDDIHEVGSVHEINSESDGVDYDEPQFIDEKWPCSDCTYRNNVNANYCEMCNNPRPGQPSYRDQLITNEQHPLPNIDIFESAIFGAGIGAALGTGVAMTNGRSTTRGALEGAGFGALGGLLMHSFARNNMMMDDDDDDLFMRNMMSRVGFGGPVGMMLPFPELHRQQQQGINEEHISQLPTRSYQSNDGKVEQCSICLENFKQGESVRTLPCLHQFHVKCVDQWLQRSQQCPVCKYEIR